MAYLTVRNRAGARALAILLAVGMSNAVAEPPTADLANWRGPRNNCYNYATDVKANNFAQPGGLPWPNVGANLTAAEWCTKVSGRANGDGLVKIAWAPGNAIPTPPTGYNLVAYGSLAGVKGGGGDYHWWRRNGDGTWSHKRGRTRAKSTYTDPTTGLEAPITDPRDANQRDGYDLCGFKGVPKNPGPTLTGPTTTAPPNGLRTWRFVHAGWPDTFVDSTSTQMFNIQLHYPTFTPSNQVPDPLWVDPPAGQDRGFGLLPGDQITGFPPFTHVFQGVVAVYFDLEGHQIQYYNDDRGLEPLLRTLFLGSECYANCDGSTGTPLLTGNDFQCFINAFANNASYANCDGSTGTPALTGNDFQCFINAFAGGCN